MKDSKLKDIWPLHDCVCGKKFITHPNWLYKLKKGRKTTYYCSYTCYRKAGGDSGKQNHYNKRSDIL